MRVFRSKPHVARPGARAVTGREQRRRNSGQSLIEMAIITPLLLLLGLGVIDMGRFAYIGILVGNAARAGAAYGAKAPGDSAGIVTATCDDFLNNLNSNPAAACDGTASTTANHLQVTSSVACGCDVSGTWTSDSNYTGATCSVVPQSYISANCGGAADHWLAQVSVQASGRFNALFAWPGIPSSATISRTATLRVP